MKTHVCLHQNDKLLKCPECPECFAKKLELKRHINSVHDRKKTFKCSICDYIFTKKVELNRHVKKKHEGKKPFNCSICNNTFAKKAELKRHINSVHDRKKPFNCSICNVMFSSDYNLKKHICVHQEPYNCPLCDQSFVEKAELTGHVNLVHDGKKRYKCQICDHCFTNILDLNQHVLKTHDRKKQFYCSICDIHFSSDQNLKKHSSVHLNNFNASVDKDVPNIGDENQIVLDHVQIEHDNLSNEGIDETVSNNNEENQMVLDHVQPELQIQTLEIDGVIYQIDEHVFVEVEADNNTNNNINLVLPVDNGNFNEFVAEIVPNSSEENQIVLDHVQIEHDNLSNEGEAVDNHVLFEHEPILEKEYCPMPAPRRINRPLQSIVDLEKPLNTNIEQVPDNANDELSFIPIPNPAPSAAQILIPIPEAIEIKRQDHPSFNNLNKIMENVLDIKKQIDVFQGENTSKDYKFLDEMLTRKLLALDDIVTGGRDDVRQQRKESIEIINHCVSILESKAKNVSIYIYLLVKIF